VTCLVAAFLIVYQTGLPVRAEFTGQIIPGELPVAPELGALAPPFMKHSLNDESVRLSDLRGRPGLINFWATWCVPCQVEMPDLEAVYQQYQQRGMWILAVNLGEMPGVIQEWVNTFGLSFDILRDEQQDVAALYQIRGQPTTYVVAPSGLITQIFYGATNRDAVEAAIAPFFPS
jgi:peroxiredoxin